MTAHSANETSRQDIGRGRYDHPAGSRGTVTQYASGAEIVRLPSGSIVSIPRFEPSLEELDPPLPGFYGALMFALPLSIILWILIVLTVWGLIVAWL